MPENIGRYVYGVAPAGAAAKLGRIGIDGSEVYTIPYEGLCAIVHDCPAEPYNSVDSDKIKGWVKSHQAVLDKAKATFGEVVPMAFDTILEPKAGDASPEQYVVDWLKKDYKRLSSFAEKIKGKDEYGVQVFYDPNVVGRLMVEQSEDIKRLKAVIAASSPGIAYMYKQKLEKVVKAEIERIAGTWFSEFYGKVKAHCEEIAVEKTKRADKDRTMMLNFSCLVSHDKVKPLGEELEKIAQMPGFTVHFSGPWPAYSFVSRHSAPPEEAGA